MSCCKIIGDNLNFCCAQVKEKFHDDLLIGTEHSKKIIPTCVTPINTIEEMSQDDKVQIVLNDPKFGMFALFKWHVKKGYKNDVLKNKKSIIKNKLKHATFYIFIDDLYRLWDS